MARCLRVPTIYGTSTGATPNKRTRAYLPYSLVAVYRMDCTDSTRLNSTLLVVESFLQDNESPTVPWYRILHSLVSWHALPCPTLPFLRRDSHNAIQWMRNAVQWMRNAMDGWMDGFHQFHPL